MYQTLYKVAQEVALQRRNSVQCTPDDTVCVIYAASQRIYTGVSRVEMQNGMMLNVHAEIDAVQQMHAGGDFAAGFILLIGIMTLQPILPCGNCISFLLGQAPENVNCQVVLPDRMIPLPQISQMNGSSIPFQALQGASMYGNSAYGAPPPQSGMFGQMPGASNMPYNGANPAVTSMYASSSYVSGMVRSRKASGSRLKDKVSGLANAGKDIGADEPEESAFIKRLFKK